MLCTPKKSCECRPRVQEDLHFSPLPTCTEVFDLTASFDTVSPIVLSSIFLNLFRMQKDSKANMFHTNLSRRYELRCHSFYFSWRQPNLLNTLKRGWVTCRRFTFIPSIHSVIFSICRCFGCYCQLSEPKNMSVYIVHLTKKEKNTNLVVTHD